MRDVNRSSVRQFVSSAGLLRFFLVLVLMGLLVLVGCTAHADPAAEAPPPANIVPGVDPALFTVDHPEQFPLAAALERPATSELVHVAQNLQRNGGSAIDGRTTRHLGYGLSQKRRKRIEECFGWLKTIALLRKLHHRGVCKVDWIFAFACAAYNLVRMRNLSAAVLAG
jgi:hypothetical protein